VSVANPERGEVALSLRSGAVVLRPTFSALVAAEGEIGSLLSLLDRAGAGDLRLGDVGPLFWHAMSVEGRRIERGQFEAELLEIGLAALLVPYRQLLAAVFGGRG
jgi:hypothetical protein